MPNHVTNVLRVSGDPEQVRAMFEAIKDDKIGLGSLDFNKVIPMPAHIFRGNLGMAEREKYGKDNWYDWSISNWGTKWNAYETKYTSDRSVYFESAWDSPINIVESFIQKFKLTCTYRAICEGGIFWFIREYENGMLISIRDQLPEDRSQLYIDLRGYDPYADDEDEE